MKKLCVIIALLPLSIAIASPIKDLKLVGQTEMNWMFWKIYDIQLLNSTGQYDRNNYPLAIKISYARDIKATQLVKTTVDEWHRQKIEWKPEWQKQLNTLWPDVGQGDEIILRVDRDLNSHFFYNQELLGSIQDDAFAPAFLAIWLSENTLKPDLKRELTGTF